MRDTKEYFIFFSLDIYFINFNFSTIGARGKNIGIECITDGGYPFILTVRIIYFKHGFFFICGPNAYASILTPCNKMVIIYALNRIN